MTWFRTEPVASHPTSSQSESKAKGMTNKTILGTPSHLCFSEVQNYKAQSLSPWKGQIFVNGAHSNVQVAVCLNDSND